MAFDDILLTVPFETDTEKAKVILEKVLDENTSVLKSPKPIVRLNEFGEQGLIFLVRGFVSSSNVNMMWEIAGEVRMGIVKQFKENNIQIIGRMHHIKMYNTELINSFLDKDKSSHGSDDYGHTAE